MNSLIWHIIKKDLRRFRALLAMWCAALVIRVVAAGLVGNDTGGRMEAGMVILFVLILFLNALMVTRVVAEDSPLKEAAFWRSRPITGRQMMTAKVFFLVVWTLILPALVVVAAGYAYGFTGWECVAVAAGQLIIHASIGALFLTTSILTQRVWAAVLGVLVLLVAVQISRGARVTPEEASPFESVSLGLSGVSVATAVGMVALGAAVTWVYRERRRPVAAAGGLFGVGSGARTPGGTSRSTGGGQGQAAQNKCEFKHQRGELPAVAGGAGVDGVDARRVEPAVSGGGTRGLGQRNGADAKP